jgi:hypothetical protein
MAAPRMRPLAGQIRTMSSRHTTQAPTATRMITRDAIQAAVKERFRAGGGGTVKRLRPKDAGVRTRSGGGVDASAFPAAKTGSTADTG